MCMFYSKHVRVLMKSKSFLNQSLCHSQNGEILASVYVKNHPIYETSL